MEGTGVARGDAQVGRTARLARIAGAIVVLAGMALVTAALIPPYLKNWRFGHELADTAAAGDARWLSDEQLRAVVAQKAAQLGLPVQPGQVEVLRESGRLRLEVKYSLKVETPLYTVDLHFRPTASGAGR